jgi:hypothetical protein
MIRYEQVGDGAPKDVKVTTDDAQAELAQIDELISQSNWEGEAAINFNAAKLEPAELSFIVPGNEAGDFGGLLYDLGMEDWLEGQNDNLIGDLSAEKGVDEG